METYTHKVQYYETDKMQITHHSNYIRFMEEARTDYLEKIGWSYQRMESEGLISPVVSIDIRYKKSTTYNDNIEIATKIVDLTAAKIEFEYTMYARGEVVCTAKSVHCFINSDGKPVSVKKLKPELYELLLTLVEKATIEIG